MSEVQVWDTRAREKWSSRGRMEQVITSLGKLVRQRLELVLRF